jgi:poly-gamma-glutamate synthesis protein (capsule biosynthesis protein)
MTDAGRNEPERTARDTATVLFGGDVLLDQGVARVIEAAGRYDAVLSPDLAEAFSQADIAMVNVEMPISTRGEEMKDKQFTFRGDPKYLPFLKDYMGLDIVTLANNHILDYGVDAMEDTLSYLEEAGIEHVGAGADIEAAMAPVVKWAGGRSIAFLGASRVIPVASWTAGTAHPGLLTTYDKTLLCDAIRKAKAGADYVVVYVHWGVEGAQTPNETQTDLAHAYIDAGADFVVGSHPHVLQTLEYYRDKFIAYSLGNFIFTDKEKDTIALRLTITPEGLFPQILFCRINHLSTELVTDRASLETRRLALEELSPGVRVGEDGMISKGGGTRVIAPR